MLRSRTTAFSVTAFFVIVLAGCGQTPAKKEGAPSSNSPNASSDPIKLKVAYIGLTCEPPIFVAYENGFFKEEGLDVELVKTDWEGLQSGLGLGKFDANHTLVMYLLKPIEAGLDVKITGGVHTGCLRVQAGIKTDIKTMADLKGKKIGITVFGSPPHLFASRALAVNGMDPKKDVDWVTFPPDAMGLALDQGRIDAVASAEPIGTILTVKEKVRTIADQATDDHYKDEFCCATAVSGKLMRENPAAAAKVTRAMLKGAKWVSVNPTAAAKLAVEKKYLAASPEINAQAISKLNYLPGVSKCRKDLDVVANEMKTAGLLKANTNAADLAKKAWADLDGLTDEWVKGIQVDQVAGGGIPAPINAEQMDALLAALPKRRTGLDGFGLCCDDEKCVFPMTGEWALVRPIRLNLARTQQGEMTLVYAGR